MRSISDIVADLEKQIAWRGPQGKVQGVLTINRTEAIELLHYVKDSPTYAREVIAPCDDAEFGMEP